MKTNAFNPEAVRHRIMVTLANQNLTSAQLEETLYDIVDSEVQKTEAAKVAISIRPNCTRDGIGHETTYRPQYLWSDGEFDLWSDIGLPTQSLRNAAARLTLFRDINKTAKTRCLKVRSTITTCELPEPTESIKDTITREAFEHTGNETGEPQS